MKEADVTPPRSGPEPRSPGAPQASDALVVRHPRRMPPVYPPATPPEAFEPHGRAARLLPLLYFAFLALVLVGSAGLLLWSQGDEDELDPEELLALGAEAPASTGVARSRWEAGLLPPATERPGRSTLHVTSTPAGAHVIVDGDTVGLTPVWLEDLPARHHLITVERPGFAPRDTLLYVGDGLRGALAFSFASPPVVPDPDAPEFPASESVVSGAAPGGRAPEAPPPPDPAPPAAPAVGSLELGATPAGATVRLDGRVVGTTPLVLERVAAGEHALTLEREGFEPAAVRVTVAPGARAAVDVALVEQTGTLGVVVRPWGSVYVDGVLRARDTDVRVELTLPVGEHTVRVEHPGLGVEERTVRVEHGKRTSLSFDLN